MDSLPLPEVPTWLLFIHFICISSGEFWLGFLKKNWKFAQTQKLQSFFVDWVMYWCMNNEEKYFSLFYHWIIYSFFFCRNLHKSDDSRQPLSPRSPKDKVKRNLRGQMSKVRKTIFCFHYVLYMILDQTTGQVSIICFWHPSSMKETELQ